MMIKRCLFTAALAVAALALPSAHALAQTQAAPVASGSASATLTAKIIAIDKTNRVITLQDTSGNTSDFQAGKDVTRFDTLKVGDTVTFTYQQSVALDIVPASSAAAPAVSSSPVVTRYAGDKPGGQVSQTQTATVVITAIDMAKPSVTVKTQDGKTITMLVEDKSNLEKFKVGDAVRITYSEALMVQVK